MQESQKGFFDSMNPKASFLFGLVSGIAITLIFSNSGIFSGEKSSASSNDNIVVINDDKEDDRSDTARAGSDRTAPPITDEDHIRGDLDAPLTWIEYSDFECPFCKRFTPMMEEMLEEYDGQIKLVYRHFPLSFHDPLATTQAEATECANEYKGNDGFWDMHDFIFDTTNSNGRGMDEDDLVQFAVELGINENDFQECLDDDRYEDHIQEDQSGGSSAGITGTPGSFFIDADGNAQLISGAVPYSQIQAIIEASLE